MIERMVEIGALNAQGGGEKYNILVWKRQGTRPLEIHRRIRHDNIKWTSVVWPVKVDEWNFFVLNSNKIYSIIFANRTESKKYIYNLFMNYIKCDIFTATKAKFLPHALTQNRPPDSRLSRNADSARPHHSNHYSFICIIFIPESPSSERNFNLFTIARTAQSHRQEWHILAVTLGANRT
jgi:hypothetical protein